MKSLNLLIAVTLVTALSACSSGTNGGGGGTTATPLTDSQQKTFKEFNRDLGNVQGANKQAKNTPNSKEESKKVVLSSVQAAEVESVDTNKVVVSALAKDLENCKFNPLTPPTKEGATIPEAGSAPDMGSIEGGSFNVPDQVFGMETTGEKCPIHFLFKTETKVKQTGKSMSMTSTGTYSFEVKDTASKFAELSDVTKVELTHKIEASGQQDVGGGMTMTGSGSAQSKKNGLVKFEISGKILVDAKGNPSGAITEKITFSDFTAVIVMTPVLVEVNGEKEQKFSYTLNGKAVTESELQGVLSASPNSDNTKEETPTPASGTDEVTMPVVPTEEEV